MSVFSRQNPDLSREAIDFIESRWDTWEMDDINYNILLREVRKAVKTHRKLDDALEEEIAFLQWDAAF